MGESSANNPTGATKAVTARAAKATRLARCPPSSPPTFSTTRYRKLPVTRGWSGESSAISEVSQTYHHLREGGKSSANNPTKVHASERVIANLPCTREWAGKSSATPPSRYTLASESSQTYRGTYEWAGKYPPRCALASELSQTYRAPTSGLQPGQHSAPPRCALVSESSRTYRAPGVVDEQPRHSAR